MTKIMVPVFKCDKKGREFSFRCPYCKIRHTHGGIGHRMAHCKSNSPYREYGYIISEKQYGDNNNIKMVDLLQSKKKKLTLKTKQDLS